jgi:hypothetical protein
VPASALWTSRRAWIFEPEVRLRERIRGEFAESQNEMPAAPVRVRTIARPQFIPDSAIE